MDLQELTLERKDGDPVRWCHERLGAIENFSKIHRILDASSVPLPSSKFRLRTGERCLEWNQLLEQAPNGNLTIQILVDHSAAPRNFEEVGARALWEWLRNASSPARAVAIVTIVVLVGLAPLLTKGGLGDCRPEKDAGPDSASDAGPGSGNDAGVDAGADAGPDGGSEAGVVGGTDARTDGDPPRRFCRFVPGGSSLQSTPGTVVGHIDNVRARDVVDFTIRIQVNGCYMQGVYVWVDGERHKLLYSSGRTASVEGQIAAGPLDVSRGSRVDVYASWENSDCGGNNAPTLEFSAKELTCTH